MRKGLISIFILKSISFFILFSFFVMIFPSKLSDSSETINNGKNIEEEDDFEIKEPRETDPEKKPEDRETPSSDNWWKYPETIYEATRDGNDLLVLVNKKFRLPSTYAPSDLVKASNSGIRKGENYYLRNIIIPDLTDMVNDSKASGIDLSIVSGYRSYQTQVSTYNYWLTKNSNNIEYVDTFSARPGHSQHQLGTVIDFSSNEIGDVLGDSFANTNAYKWLTENAYRYGFVISYPKGYESITGYKYESWHYRYIGKSNALEMKNSKSILEEYLRNKN